MIDWGHAMLRGRYAAALARTEEIGIPLDVPLVKRAAHHREPVLDRMVVEMDNYGLFEGRTFKQDRFAQWRAEQGMEWPLTESGQDDLRDQTFKEMAETYPQLKPIRQLRKTLAGMRLHPDQIDEDGRIRCFLNPYGTSTGRNAARPNKFIPAAPKWNRGFVKPSFGIGLGSIDFSSEEIGVAAAFSSDENMQEAYRSGDDYFWFAQKGELIPSETTPATFQPLRPLYKMAFLAINYGISPESLGLRINRPPIFARHLIERHHDLFRDYWKWSDNALNHATLFGWQSTVFGWIHRLPSEPRPCAMRNFPVQANGAELLRLAHCLLTENGIRVCAPNHDSFLIEAPLDILDQEIKRARTLMAEASRVVLHGFELFTDVKTVRYPERYLCSEGRPMWDLVMRLLQEIESETSAHVENEDPVFV